MKFGPIPLAEAEGAVLAHATVAGERRLRKAHRLSLEDIAALGEAGFETVTAAVPAPDDLDEDAAAERIAAGLKTRDIETKPPATGRVNLHAGTAGVFTVDRAMIDAVNRIDPAITVATIEDHACVAEGAMVATVKIIPFAVAEDLVRQAVSLLSRGEVFAVEAFLPHRVGLVQTVLASVKQSALDKTARLTAARLDRSASSIVRELRPAHETAPVAGAIRDLAGKSDMLLVFGASAVCDPDDVIPAAIRQAGGTVERVGMPVDPGNLLVLGELDGKPVLGAPGCARSPKLNGFDWVLDRLVAGLAVTGDDIAGMGVGGLLMEIPTRPQPREAEKKPAPPSAVWAVLLAAGQSRRMGAGNKLLAEFDGLALVRRTAGHVAASGAAGAIAILGHQAEAVGGALSGLDMRLVENPDFASGLASSLKAGIRALPAKAAGALVVLADMPEVSSADLDRLIDAFADAGGEAVVRATHNGKRGNPVVLPRALFGEIEGLEGDTGARHIVETTGLEVIDVELGAAASLDVDTPEALREAGGELSLQEP